MLWKCKNAVSCLFCKLKHHKIFLMGLRQSDWKRVNWGTRTFHHPACWMSSGWLYSLITQRRLQWGEHNASSGGDTLVLQCEQCWTWSWFEVGTKEHFQIKCSGTLTGQLTSAQEGDSIGGQATCISGRKLLRQRLWAELSDSEVAGATRARCTWRRYQWEAQGQP